MKITQPETKFTQLVSTAADTASVGSVPVSPLPLTGTDGYVLTYVAADVALELKAPTGFANPMTTPADIIVGGTAGAPTRLAKGSDGQVLTVDPTTHLLLWATPASTGMANPMTTVGDIIVGGTVTAGVAAPARLGIGTANQLLHGGTTPAYSAVVEADLSLSAVTTADVSTSKHGFAPILPNDATKYLDGTGAYSAPTGSSHYVVMASGGLTPPDPVLTSDGLDWVYSS